MTLGGVAPRPWSDTFFFYDNQCQMVFDKGECKPRLVRNYVGQWNMQDEFEEKVPPLFLLSVFFYSYFLLICLCVHLTTMSTAIGTVAVVW
ncbi:hypothetical protein [Paenibacillus oryzisoli]|uniref:hypothetical protein n=1 Tax=Paenibacillus oryzisoli TaxID=1850517 RepID=UPI000837F989|nr:hypothetical protein [Paenibacillus oryzisoli]